MLFLNLEQTRAAKFWVPPQTVKQWIFTRVAAYQEAARRRRELDMLLELRDRDPRLFEEIGVSPDDLPPPQKPGVPLLTQTVLASYFFGLHGK